MLNAYLPPPRDNIQHTQAEFVYEQKASDVFTINRYVHAKTEAGDIPPEKQERQSYETSTGVGHNWINPENSESFVRPTYKISYTEDYVLFNLAVLARKIEKEFDLWLQKGTENSMVHVAEVRSLIKQFRPYVSQDNDARLVSSLLSLMFDNNAWDSMSIEKLRHVKSIVSRFMNRQVNKKEVLSFIKDISSSNLAILASVS